MGYSQSTYLNTYHPEPDFELGSNGVILKCKNGDQIFSNILEVPSISQNQYMLTISRVDSKGNIVWNAALQEQYYTAEKIFEDLDGNFYLFTDNYIHACLVKISATGQVVWSKHYGDSSGFIDAIMLTTGDFVAIGQVVNKNGWKYDSYIVKIDQDGEILWEKSTNFEDGGSAETIINTEDGGMIIGGSRDGELKFPGGSLYFAKIDPNGNLLWIRSLGYLNSVTKKILNTGTSNYTIVSNGLTTNSGTIFQILLTNIDETGKLNWSKWITNSNGGDYLVADAIIKYNKLIISGQDIKTGPFKLFLLNTSLTGKINWLSLFTPSYSYMNKFQLDNADGFNLCGIYEEEPNSFLGFPAIMQTDSLGQIPCLSEIDYNPPLQVLDYPVKIDSGGTLITLNNVAVLDTPIIRTDITFTKKVICESNATQNIQNSASRLFTIYPNPASSEISIELTPAYQAYGTKQQIEISDALGRKVYSGAIDRSGPAIIPTGSISPGYYVVSMVSNGKLLQSQKLVVTE